MILRYLITSKTSFDNARTLQHAAPLLYMPITHEAEENYDLRSKSNFHNTSKYFPPDKRQYVQYNYVRQDEEIHYQLLPTSQEF
jgi:hypothetical protein